MGWTGRVMDDHEAFLYLHHGSCGCCVYVYITQDGQQEYIKSRQRIMALQDEIQQELEKLERAFMANRMQSHPISMEKYSGDILLAQRMQRQGKWYEKILKGCKEWITF